jgi:hypothetical protein
MANREQEFNACSKFDFSELVKIKFKSGHQPRNATDYYYCSKNKTIYSYYFGDKLGFWNANAQIDINSIKSPSELSIYTEKSETKNLFLVQNKNQEKVFDKESEYTSDEIKTLEFKLSENYKLELEIKKLEAERKLIESQIELKKLKHKYI